ncbi:secreted antigen 1 [Babesia caballi]|uniref:Secreted antigen 1 n=1 Tax=Babesia caballi TaxID=5871 RepID=A0AAV4LSS3_BABCB|nr:secreted antigen 1 [Babesia caballi]
MEKDCFKVPLPTTLKEALDMLGALSGSDLKQRVSEALEKRLKTVPKIDTTPMSVFDYSNYTTISQNFDKVLDGLESLRKEIVDENNPNTYGEYRHLQFSSDDDACVEICVKYICDILPILYATLGFLEFEVNDDNEQLGGGGWEEQYINGQDNVDSGHSLSKWLKSRQPDSLSASGSPSEFSPTFLPGGYGSDLKEVQGGELVSTLNDILIDSGLGEDGFLQHLFLDFGIVTKWSPCNVATCLAVLAALCKKSPTFGNRITKYEGLNRVLESLPANLELLAPDKENDT